MNSWYLAKLELSFVSSTFQDVYQRYRQKERYRTKLCDSITYTNGSKTKNKTTTQRRHQDVR